MSPEQHSVHLIHTTDRTSCATTEQLELLSLSQCISDREESLMHLPGKCTQPKHTRNFTKQMYRKGSEPFHSDPVIGIKNSFNLATYACFSEDLFYWGFFVLLWVLVFFLIYKAISSAHPQFFFLVSFSSPEGMIFPLFLCM